MLVLNIVTSLNLLLLFSLLFFRKDNALPNKLLALILINPAINFISNINTLAGNLTQLPYIYFFAQVTCMLFAPLVHMYIMVMMGKKIRFNHPLYIISMVCIAVSVYYALEFGFILSPAEQEIYLTGIQHEPYPDQMVLVNGLFILMQQVYFTVLAVEVYRYRKYLRNTVSSFNKTRVVYIVRFVQLIWLLNIITVILYATLPTIQVEYIFLPIVLTAIYFFILYFSFHHHSIFTEASYQAFLLNNAPLLNLSTPKEAPVPFSEEKETLAATVSAVPSSQVLETIAQRVKAHLMETMCYTNPDLTINTLAEQMNLPAGKISVAINKVLGKSFFELINQNRIERSRELLRTRKDLTIEGIAYEAGFNSRAAFYRSFKKHAGTTPSEYLDSITV